MNLQTLVAAILIVSAQNFSSSAANLEPNIGNNWYVPNPSNKPQADGPSSSYNEAGFATDQSVPTSFIPTTNALSPQNQGPSVENLIRSNFYGMQQQPPTSIPSGTGKQYQYLQYYPDGNAFHIYPAQGPETAVQRQEFLNPNINELLPLGGNSPVDGIEDGADGGSILDNLPSLGGITGGITGTAANIAQSIGLGSLGILGSIIVLAVGAPLIVFAILFPVAILIIAILGFPVLQLTLPPSDPNLGRKLKSRILDTAGKARQILQSEECVERFSCELARKSRRLPYEKWILEKMDKTNNTWANRVSKSVKSGRAGEDCKRFTCSPVAKMKHIYDTVTSTTVKYFGTS